MAPSYTEFLKLTKPRANETYDVATWNTNMDALDAGVKGAKRNKAATILIGNTAAGHTAADCDVLCDGTNDAAKIMQKTNTNGRFARKVVLLEGTYYLEQPLYISSNVILEGLGQNITVLKRRFSSGAMIYYANTSYNDETYGTYLANTAVRELTLDGQRSTYNSVNNVGVYYNGTSEKGNIELSHVTIKDCYIGVKAMYSSNLAMQNCILLDCFTGVNLTGAGGALVEDCTLEGDGASGSTGILTDSNTHTFRFTGNKTSRFLRHFYVKGQKGTVEGNYMFLESSQHGVCLSGAKMVNVLGNRIKCYAASTVGVECMDSSTQCRISENSIHNVSTASSVVGIFSQASTNCSFAGNQIVCASGSAGVQIPSGSGHQITNNAILNPGVGIETGTSSATTAPSNLSIVGNQILNATSKGVRVLVSCSSITANLITLSGGTGSIDLYGTNVGSSGNVVANNMIWGKNYSQGTNCTNNIFDNNKYN